MFEKDGHCGFTPIADMLDVRDRPNQPAPGPFQEQRLVQAIDPIGLLRLPPRRTDYLALPLRLPAPLAQYRDKLEGLLGKFSGFVPLAGGNGGEAPGKKWPKVEAGLPLSVILVDGDISLGATGTATYVDGDRVLAFGHPFMCMGLLDLPIGPAEIVTTVPSYDYPYKLSNEGPPMGKMQQDRLSAIAGTWGQMAPMGSYRIRRKHEGQQRPDWKGRFALNSELTPMLMVMLTLSAVLEQQDMSMETTLQIKGQIEFEGLPALNLGGIYSGGMDVYFDAILDQLLPVMQLYSRYPQAPLPSRFELEVDTNESAQAWKIKSVALNKQNAQAGDSLSIVARLSDRAGNEIVKSAEFILPEELKSGSFGVRVVSGSTLMDEARGAGGGCGFMFFFGFEGGKEAGPADFIRDWNQRYARDSLYAQIVRSGYASGQGARSMSDLPLSAYQLLEKRQERVRFGFHRPNVLLEKIIPLPGEVQGAWETNLTAP
jgi:hypothetical protein